MHKVRVGLAATVVALLLLPQIASAKNYCIGGFPNTAYILLGAGFKIPPKGSCRAWIGFNKQGHSASSGTACTASDGSDVNFSITTGTESGGFAEIDAINLSLPSQTGSVTGQEIEGDGVNTFSATGITGSVCGKFSVPSVRTSGQLLPGGE